MRTFRNTLVGAVLVALLAGSGAAVMAQDDELVPSSATGTLEFVEPATEAAMGEGGDAVAHDEATLHVHEWTSSDPRLTGTATYTGSWHIYNPPAEDCDDPEAEAGAVYEIVNDGGSWRCAAFRAPIPGPDGATNVHTLAFRGTGGYEGLSAYVLVDWSTSPFTYGALITPNTVPIVPVLEG
jgi:hypothetical protein